MPTTTTDDSVPKSDEMIEVDAKSGVSIKTSPEDSSVGKEKAELLGKGIVATEGEEVAEKKTKSDKVEETVVPEEIEPKTGVSFPSKLEDGKNLTAVGVRKKSMLGLGIKIYAFGIYAENEKLKDLITQKKMEKPAANKANKEMYEMVIDSDVAIMVRLVIVYSGLTMSMVRKGFDEGLGAAIKKLTGGKNQQLTKKMMGEVSDDLKLTTGSVIEISRLPGYILQTKVMGEVVSEVNNELLCRAYMYLYLGDDPFDKETKDKFGTTLLSLY